MSKINRSELARDLGINLAHISRIFSGQSRPSLELAMGLAKELCVSMEELVRFLDSIRDSIREGREHGDEIEGKDGG